MRGKSGLLSSRLGFSKFLSAAHKNKHTPRTQRHRKTRVILVRSQEETYLAGILTQLQYRALGLKLLASSKIDLYTKSCRRCCLSNCCFAIHNKYNSFLWDWETNHMVFSNSTLYKKTLVDNDHLSLKIKYCACFTKPHNKKIQLWGLYKIISILIFLCIISKKNITEFLFVPVKKLTAPLFLWNAKSYSWV